MRQKKQNGAARIDARSSMTCIELCAGAGGQALGLEQAGFDHLALVEIDEDCCKTLRLNRPSWRVINQDIRDLVGNISEFGKPDLLAAGLPCPPFSIAGKKLGNEDERDLFPTALKLISELSPRAVMIENVKGFLDPKFAAYRQEFTESLSDLGYGVSMKLLNASDFGVPQLRPRVLIVALRDYMGPDFGWPVARSIISPTVGDVLFDLMSERGWMLAADWSEGANRIAPTVVGGSKKHGGPDLGPTRAKRAWQELGVNGHTIAEHPPERDFCGMPRLTVRMVARLQGFPDSWNFYGKKTSAYRQVGNAFPPPVAHAVASAIRDHLFEQALEETAS